MTKMRLELYTQSKNSCAVTTCFNILRARYGILFTQAQRDKCKQEAKSNWIWSEQKGTTFTRFYNWFAGWIYRETWLELEVLVYDILTDEFDRAYENWVWFGIWLLYAWKFYRDVREDWEITLEEIQNTNKEDYKYYWHNLFWKLDYIVWILQSIDYDKKIIKFQKEALKEWVKKGLFWQTARSFKSTDSLLDYYLVELNKGTVFEWVELLPKDHRKALDKAIKLRTYVK